MAGSTETSLFEELEQSSETEISNRDRFVRFFDRYVYAPLRVALGDWRTVVGFLLIAFFILMGTVGVRIVPEPSLNEALPYTSPFTTDVAPLGTDNLGQPVGKQIVHATPAMLKMAFAGAVVATGFACIVGILAGYAGGKIDEALMTMTDIVLTIPALPLVVLLAAIYPPEDPFVVGIILAIDNWPGLARALRSQVLTIREESYVEAARAIGIPSRTILRRDVTPQLMPYILINAAQSARRIIFESVALYFLGLLPFSTFNWGVMMNEAYGTGAALSNPDLAGHWLFFPMAALVGFSFGLILFSQGMDRVFNPQLRAKYARTVEDDEGETGAAVS